MTTYYKWLDDGCVTPLTRTPWPVPVGEWTPVVTDPVLCERGRYSNWLVVRLESGY